MCTRIVYLGKYGQTITTRTMDFRYEIGTNLWIFPRGMYRYGIAGPNSVGWESQYGSVIASGYDISTTDGINEKGLMANLLWLAESKYPQPNDKRPALSISLWAQFMLDNYATVAEAVESLENDPFVVMTDEVPGQGRLATLHLSLSDASGDSAIIEYIDGEQVIHHSRKYQVMTNSPTYEEQLEMQEYWENIPGTEELPGTNRSPDRFARAQFYINAIPQETTPNKAVASVFSVIRNVSVPYGLAIDDSIEISSTRWRTLVDHKRQLYFFESALTPNIFWTDLKKIDFSAKTGKVKKLDLGEGQSNIFSGDATEDYVDSEPFEFKGLSEKELDGEI
ncbi:linear amide C-N hydrolase [Xenorhabdus szentirmaii]|uniref:Choloylglycine hydrolase/NAAA C-terminal domain-containing protein n=2 Tax=Xenorhabdus szentirmaii TaxID=290112 RepID=W1J122_9GAMM|nr:MULTISPECIES: linear amide C-N hydrolase [Xenorhabdus]MBD2779831.1 linear amide C-N hydrolase [Xenorhabdus sp. 38]MBD2791680.1 linear amide C-N hydrolase [Xenorhabdus sp. CUL]MBD2800266.1 linear amide C-N hydrolase [Xenorhabdus sp. M]MBD2804370.1 linear amide C-N hydrolase [Xenorhabdus sp. ZM]MBD2821844.1 linear amide C-N hydrolase [Xenorhabdus sp. 42]